MQNVFNNFLNIISNTLFPIKCILCNQDKAYLCMGCESKLPLVQSDKNLPNWIFAKYKYQNYNIKKIEHSIKYKHHPKLAEIMGEYSYNFILNNISIKHPNQNMFLIPIPISKGRLKQRGYNQTEYIVRGVTKMNPNFKILNILKRKETIKLKDIYGVDNRSEEMRYSMSVDVSLIGGGEAAATMNSKINLNNLDIKNKNNIYILIDDITTTGSTFYEARRALVEYGITLGNIYSYAIAH